MMRSALSPLERWILVTIGVLTVLIILLLVWGDQTVPRVRSFNWDNRVVSAQDRGLILTFNRPMDRDSVEENLAITPALPGKFSWAGRRMAYTLDDPIPYGQTFTVSLAKAQDQFKQRSIPVDSPFSSQFKSRDQAFVYLGIGEEEHQLILYNLTRQEKQILTPKDLVVVDFEPYPESDRILFSAADRVQYDQGNFDLQIYSVTTGIDYQQGVTSAEAQASEVTAGEVKLLIPSDEYQNLKFDLSPDGKAIVVQRANKKNPGVDFGLWILREGKALEPLKTEPGGDFLITPDSKSMIMAQGQGLAVLPLESEAEPLDFLPQFGRVMGLSPDGRQAAMVRFNTDYTRSLFLVTNQSKPKELWRTNGSILKVIFSPDRKILYCLGSQLLPGDTYVEEPFFLAIDLTAALESGSSEPSTSDNSTSENPVPKNQTPENQTSETPNPENLAPEPVGPQMPNSDPNSNPNSESAPESTIALESTEDPLPPEAITPLLKLPIQRNIAMSLSPDGIALLFDQVQQTDQNTAESRSVDNARLWVLPLIPDRFETKNKTLPNPEVLPLPGSNPQWLP
jgi:hypothetical protein